MDIGTASYIINYFPRLLTLDEAAALRHKNTMFKILSASGISSPEEYKRKVARFEDKGWLSKKPEVLKMVEKENDELLIFIAQQVLSRSEELVHFNYCPKCGHLARTPLAKQCRLCAHSWHGT